MAVVTESVCAWRSKKKWPIVYGNWQVGNLSYVCFNLLVTGCFHGYWFVVFSGMYRFEFRSYARMVDVRYELIDFIGLHIFT